MIHQKMTLTIALFLCLSMTAILTDGSPSGIGASIENPSKTNASISKDPIESILSLASLYILKIASEAPPSIVPAAPIHTSTPQPSVNIATLENFNSDVTGVPYVLPGILPIRQSESNKNSHILQSISSQPHPSKYVANQPHLSKQVANQPPLLPVYPASSVGLHITQSPTPLPVIPPTPKESLYPLDEFALLVDFNQKNAPDFPQGTTDLNPPSSHAEFKHLDSVNSVKAIHYAAYNLETMPCLDTCNFRSAYGECVTNVTCCYETFTEGTDFLNCLSIGKREISLDRDGDSYFVNEIH